jgi:HSP20 family protein
LTLHHFRNAKEAAMASRFFVPFGGRYPARRGDPFMSLHREMNRLFDDAYHSLGDDDRGGGISIPQLDVHESGQELCITADLPGVAESDIDLRIEGDMLIIRGEKQHRQDREEGGYRLAERSSGAFQRWLRLPFEADPGSVTADYVNGVLTIHVPKQAQQERNRRIPVGRGEGASAGTIEAKSDAANDHRTAERQRAASQDRVQQAGGSQDSASNQRGSGKTGQPKG